MRLIFFFFLAGAVLLPDGLAEAKSSAVVVELYTSQGCSSCPPADKLISTWGESGFEKDGLIPLSFHVDIWDSPAWKDAFSSPLYSTRQSMYANILGNPSIYTPQLIIAGQAAFVGSDATRARYESTRLRTSGDDFPIEIHLEMNNRILTANVQVSSVQAPPGQNNLHVYLALFENDLDRKSVV